MSKSSHPQALSGKAAITGGLRSIQSKAISFSVLAATILAPSQFAFAAFGDGGAPTILNSNVLSGQAEDPKIDGSTGAFTQKVPLDIPPGRNGLQPDVSLQYNSQNTSDGIVGYGWSLSTPYIQRINKTGSQELYSGTSYFTSSIDGELALDGTAQSSATTSPTILDALPLTLHKGTAITSDSWTYTVPSGGQNKLLVVLFAGNADPITASQNGSPLSCSRINGVIDRAYHTVCYLAAPTSGTFSISWINAGGYQASMFTLQNAAQTSPIDAKYVNDIEASAPSVTTSTTTSVGYDLLIDHVVGSAASIAHSFGAGQTELLTGGSDPYGKDSQSYKAAAATPGSESMTRNFSPNDTGDDLAMVAIKAWQSSYISTSSTYSARVDDGSHTLYTFSTSTNTWTAYDKRGTRYTYGSDDSGRMYDTSTGTSTNTYKWMLQEIRDTNDNYIKYTYNRDNNQLYPYKISYTGRGSIDGIDTVVFATSTRTDTRLSYAAGFPATTTKVISQVTAAVNGITVRQYDLTYGTGDNGTRSMLMSVQQKGYDENNNLTTLPAMTFGYLATSTQFYAPGIQNILSSSYALADINGNGINDETLLMPAPMYGYIYPDNSGPGSILLKDLGDTSPEYWAELSSLTPLERGVRYIDINGDGKADVIRGWVDDQAGNSDFAIYKNTHASSTSDRFSWTATSTNFTGSVPTFAKRTSGGLVLTGGLFGDVNGDGLPDYVTALPGTLATTTYLGNGSAFDATTTIFVAPKSFPTSVPTETASQLVDINGDGLDDWVYSSSSKMYVLLNTGTGWASTPDPRWTFATSTLYLGTSSPTTYYDRGIRFMDLNGDGLPDLVRAYKNTTGCSGEAADVKAVYLNTGSGWATSTAYTLPAYITSCNAGSFSFNEYANFKGNGQFQQDVLTSIINPTGGGLSVTYTTSASTTANPDAAISLLTASKITTNDGRGNYATTSYSYTNGQWYTGSGVRDRRFGGFSPVTVTSPDSIVTTYFNQNALARLGHPTRTEVSDLSGSLLRRTINRWDTAQHGNGTFTLLGRQLIQDFGADGSHRDKAADYQYSSTTGDVVKIIQYGEVTGNPDSSFTDIAGDSRTTNISYVASSSVNLSSPIEKTTLDNHSATTSDQKLYYDSLPFGQVSLGNNTRQEDWISGTTYASTTKTYNSYGLVATSTDRNGNATSYVYDAYNLFPATTTNALLQKTQAYFNYSNGKIKQSIDPNNRLTLNLYDGIGRLKETAQSDVTTPTSYATTTVYAYTDTPASSIRRSDYLNAATSTDTYEYYDGLGRLIQTRKSSAASNIYSVHDRIYNTAGQLASTSLPYFSSGSASTSATAIAALYTNYFYDSLQRVTRVSNAVGDTTNTYSQWETTTTDPNGHKKDYWNDAFGNLVNVVERLSSLVTTTYEYDPLNNLATTTDALGNVRHFTYDGLSRRVTAQDLHAPADSTFGSWSYTYDNQGNLTSQTDPKGQLVNRTYDALNRMTTEDYTGQAGTEVSLTYDSCTNGIGNICIASSTSARTTNAYDILGRVTSATTTVSNIAYNISYTYDRLGSITTATYPDGGQAKYTYNAAGQTSRIERRPFGGVFSDTISNYDYAPHGQILNALFGNNASTTYFYDANAMYRLSNLQTTQGGATSTQKLAYTYDPVGNITQIVNSASTSAQATTAYTYDTLNRLLSASAPSATSSPYAQTFTYDLLGNITAIAPTLYSGDISGAATTSPTILDALPLTLHTGTAITSDSWTYTVPSGGQNKLLVVLFAGNSDPITASQNGSPLSCSRINGVIDRAYHTVCYLAAPTSGTFSISWINAGGYQASMFTLQNAAQTSPIDAKYVNDIEASAPSVTTSTTTSVGYDLLIDHVVGSAASIAHSFGAGQTELLTGGSDPYGKDSQSYKAAAATPDTESMTRNFSPNDTGDDLAMVAIKAFVGAPQNSTTTTSTYTYAGTGYANPDAPTQIANGLSTSTFSYDNNGNLIQKTVDGTTTTYVYDYANRLTALGTRANGVSATTTYGYNAFGERVIQTGTSTTWLYPFKWYSVASSTGSGAKNATTTEYIFNGDTLVSTVDQQFASGVATGSAQTRYVHPDHLGSTNVVTNASGTVVQTLDYYPYGSTRISSGQNAESRQYIGQFSDPSALSYLNARYYDNSRGQFLSEDPSFLAVGDLGLIKRVAGNDQRSFLADPQLANSYSYGRNNPITQKDPSGNNPFILGGAVLGDFYGIGLQLQYDLASGQTSSVPTYVAAGLKGVAQGAATAAALNYLGPVSVLDYYGYYQSYQGLRDFNEQILSANSIKYTENQQRMTAGAVWLDATQRIADAFTPMPARAAYDAITSIMYSLIQISNQLSNLRTSQNANTRASAGGPASQPIQKSTSGGGSSSQTSSNNGGWGNSHTACGNLCS